MYSDFQLEKASICHPKPANLIRSSDYQRHKNRPTEPQDIVWSRFKLDSSRFFQGDIKVH